MKIIKKLDKDELQGRKIGLRIPKRVLFLLPDKVSWWEVALSKKEVEKLKFIRDLTWKKEFKALNTIGEIVERILGDKEGGIHTRVIKNKIKNWRHLEKKPFLIILSLSGYLMGPYTIIDGHHRLISLLLKGRRIKSLKAILAVVKEGQHKRKLKELVGEEATTGRDTS